jgi:hypothetical protein
MVPPYPHPISAANQKPVTLHLGVPLNRKMQLRKYMVLILYIKIYLENICILNSFKFVQQLTTQSGVEEIFEPSESK